MHADHPAFGDHYRAKTAVLGGIIALGHPINVHVVRVEPESITVLEVDPPHAEAAFAPAWFLENYEPTSPPPARVGQ